MKRNHTLVEAVLAAGVFAVLVAAGIARSEEKHSGPPPQGGASLTHRLDAREMRE